MADKNNKPIDASDCVHSHPVPAEELSRYSIVRDPHSEQDIANYVEGQPRDETVQHVEKIKEEIVLGEVHEIWDVTTDKDRWWVSGLLMAVYNPPHPGELAAKLDVAASTLSRILKGSSRVTPEMALRLSKAIGRSPESWLAMQGSHDLWVARKHVNLQRVGKLKLAAA